MKVMTVLGTRPEIIRLSRIIPLLDNVSEHKLVHTGQNFVPVLNEIFFAELGLRPPDHVLSCKARTLMGQIGKILTGCEQLMRREKPDRLLVLGDTNSALCAMAAKRMGIQVIHMEAGNRCFDDRVPEEVNRRIVDHCSDILLPYTERSRANLLREGIPGERIYVTGNPIFEVLTHYAQEIADSQALKTFGVEAGRYFLITLHRAENVDIPERLNKFIAAFKLLQKEYGLPMVLSLHPRTRSRLGSVGKDMAGAGIMAIEPIGLFDFVQLQRNAFCVLTDSGTVQEECCICQVPNVTLRDVTERPETVEAGSSIMTGCEPAKILGAVKTVLSLPCQWEPPPEYLVKNVSCKVIKTIVQG